MTTERRRNMRPETCRACGKPCEAGQGYLYQDTHSRRRNRYTGRFLWFVKCEECHSESKTRTTVAMERHTAAHAADPVIRPWSLSQVKTWTVSRITHEDDVAIQVTAKTFSEIISYRERISGRFTAPTGYAMEQITLNGKPISQAAAAWLTIHVLPIVNAVQSEEEASGAAAVTKLIVVGATASRHPCGYGWKVQYQGFDGYLWGCIDGQNKVTGLNNGQWIETTSDALIKESR